jgi:abortive infection bacteriophage resistance protein
LDPNRYDAKFDFQRFSDECRRECYRSDETFIKSYCEKYDQPELPPAWMMSEILSIGRWSKVFKHLADHGVKKSVARHFATKPYYLESWIHALSVLRNLCAHHCRIWNRHFIVSPTLPDSLKPLVSGNTKLAALFVILAHLLKPLGKNITFQREWDTLLTAFPDVPQDKMGFLPGGNNRENRSGHEFEVR